MATAEVTSQPAVTADPAEGKGVVLYDGQCPFCRRSVRSLGRLDWLHKLHFQDCNDAANLPKSAVPLDPDKMLEEMHLVTPDRERVYAGFGAFRWMAWRVPVLFPFAWMLYVPGVRDALATVERYTVARQYQPVLERMTVTGRG